MGYVVPQTRIETVPAGEYAARFKSFEMVEGKYGQNFKVRFELDMGKELTGFCSVVFNPKSKLYAWTRAAFNGRNIPPDWTFDSDRLIGRKVILSVVRRTDDKGEMFNKIDNVLPVENLASGASAPAPAPQPAPQPVTPPAPAPSDDDDPFGDDVDAIPF